MNASSITSRLPLPHWVSGYRRADLRGDLTAGVTVAAMLVPQSMAYAVLAGLPPSVGLAAATLPLVAYALIGTSRQLAVGPVAIASLLTASALAPLVDEGSVGYLTAAALLALMVGAVHLLLGALRLGAVANLLSHSVLVGFTAAAAIVIGASQVKHLLGVSLPRTDDVIATMRELSRVMGDIHGPTAAIGAGSIVALLALRRFVPMVPGALVVVAASTAIVGVFGLGSTAERTGVATVGTIPGSLPSFGLPAFDGGLMRSLVTAAVIITLVGFVESMAVAGVYARRSGYALDPNRELIGLGAANLTAGAFGGYPVTGGFSRTAVNATAGARTQVASLVTAGLVLVTLAVFTPLLSSLPQATLGAIIVVAVVNLVDVGEMRRLVRVSPTDAAPLATAFLATLAFGIEVGLGVAIAVSVLVVFARSSKPHVAHLGRIPGTTNYRNIERFASALTVDGVRALRVDAPLSFVNAATIARSLMDAADAITPGPGGRRTLVLDCSAIGSIDATGAGMLASLADDLADRGIALRLADVKGPVRDALRRAGLWQRLDGHVHPTTHHAVVEAAGGHPDPIELDCLDEREASRHSATRPAAVSATGGGDGESGDVWSQLVHSHDRFAEAHCDGAVAPHRPAAAVLACSDARVPPTLLFGRSPGELFVVRLAGNVASPEAIASLTFATEYLGTGQVVVLGHTSCGAIEAALAGTDDPALQPLLASLAIGDGSAERPRSPDDAARAHVANTLTLLATHSGPLGRSIRAGKVALRGVVHDLRTGHLDDVAAPIDIPIDTPTPSGGTP